MFVRGQCRLCYFPRLFPIDGAVTGVIVAWLRRLVRGEYGLACTYWLGWGLCGGMAVIPLLLFLVAADAIDSVVAKALAWVCGIAIYGGYNALAMIGVWRAANAHAGWRICAVWAKVNVGLACMGFPVLALVLAVVLVFPPAS